MFLRKNHQISIKFGVNRGGIRRNTLPMSEIHFSLSYLPGGWGNNSPQKPFLYLINRFSQILPWIVFNLIEINCSCPKFKFKFLPSSQEGGLYPVWGFLDPMYRLPPNMVWKLLNPTNFHLNFFPPKTYITQLCTFSYIMFIYRKCFWVGADKHSIVELQWRF